MTRGEGARPVARIGGGGNVHGDDVHGGNVHGDDVHGDDVGGGDVGGDGAAAPPPRLRVGVSTRALFNAAEEHGVFTERGAEAYAGLQRAREATPMAPGRAFDLVRRLLDLGARDGTPDVEVVLMSRNPPDLALRAFASAAHHGLAIDAGSFTGGRPLAPYVAAWGLDLLLCDHPDDLAAAVAAGVAAARFADVPAGPRRRGGELRIALDGDRVLFCGEADRVFEAEGLAAFHRHEAEHAARPLADGPFANLLRRLGPLRAAAGADGRPAVRIALVTARSAPAHARAINTLRSWGVGVDEAHFVGGRAKAPLLAAFDAHAFFDDRESHVLAAPRGVAAAVVPGVHDGGAAGGGPSRTRPGRDDLPSGRRLPP